MGFHVPLWRKGGTFVQQVVWPLGGMMREEDLREDDARENDIWETNICEADIDFFPVLSYQLKTS